MGFLPWVIQVAFPRESQLQHAGCFSVSMIHQTLTWTTGSLTCAQMLMHAIAHGGVQTHVRESALKVGSGRKIPGSNREWNLCQHSDSLMLYQLSYTLTRFTD